LLNEPVKINPVNPENATDENSLELAVIDESVNGFRIDPENLSGLLNGAQAWLALAHPTLPKLFLSIHLPVIIVRMIEFLVNTSYGF
jgi:hypothetical protein